MIVHTTSDVFMFYVLMFLCSAILFLKVCSSTNNTEMVTSFTTLTTFLVIVAFVTGQDDASTTPTSLTCEEVSSTSSSPISSGEENVSSDPGITPQGRWMSHEEKIENIRFLMLDRKCEVAEQKEASGFFAFLKKKEENKTRLLGGDKQGRSDL